MRYDIYLKKIRKFYRIKLDHAYSLIILSQISKHHYY